MKSFTKNEFIGVSLIFLMVFVLLITNLQTSIRRARDSQRMADIGAIADAVETFQREFGFFPPSKDGKILGCRGDNFETKYQEAQKKNPFDRELFFEGLRPCEFGIDAFFDVTDESRPKYLSTIPGDPKRELGYTYVYFSNTNRYQLYTYLEGGDDVDGYDSSIVGRNLSCGVGICSFGKGFSFTPLDRSIEEYENELLKK